MYSEPDSEKEDESDDEDDDDFKNGSISKIK